MIILILAFIILVATQSLIPRTLFVVLLAALFMGWVVMLPWGAIVIAPAFKNVFEGNYHPDPNVRALQRGEITIEEYARRKAEAAPNSNALQASSQHSSDLQRKA